MFDSKLETSVQTLWHLPSRLYTHSGAIHTFCKLQVTWISVRDVRGILLPWQPVRWRQEGVWGCELWDVVMIEV